MKHVLHGHYAFLVPRQCDLAFAIPQPTRQCGSVLVTFRVREVWGLTCLCRQDSTQGSSTLELTTHQEAGRKRAQNQGRKQATVTNSTTNRRSHLLLVPSIQAACHQVHKFKPPTKRRGSSEELPAESQGRRRCQGLWQKQANI